MESTEPERRGNGSSTLLDPERAARRFADHPDAVAESGRLADRLRFDLTRDLGYSYPGSEDGSADQRLSQACRARFGERYDGTPERAEADRQLEEELRVIAKLGLSGFFLLHRDLLELARDVAVEVRGPDSARSLLPPGRGRGSSVSSVVCYLTGLSHVDPIKAGLFLGRFLNEEITAMPDIDLDFPRDVRERLIPRIHERYGPERSALVAAFPTFRTKGAIRDIGKALGLPAGEIERVARAVSSYATYEPRDTPSEPDPNQARDGAAEVIDPELGIHPEIAEAIGEQRAGSERWLALARLMEEAYGLPRHPSQHSGGMVLSTRPLIDLCPIVPAAMEGRQIVQWDKDSCADAGFLKVDLLGLGMLSAVERTVNEVARVRSERIDLSRIPLDDPEVYRQIQRAETTGVFQIESRAQMQMLPRSLPENIEDLTVQVALVRPGPIQGGAVHPYLERKKRLREDPDYQVPYEHPSLEPILSDTLGAIVFQDQVIQVAMALSGFSSGEAEGLRRAMSRKRSDEAMRSYRDRFVEGAVSEGVDREIGERVFEQIRGFSGFGFPKSHAAAFGLLAYQSTWLRVHYGPEFLCALLNEQPMGFYPPDALVHEAQRRGIEVRGPDVNRSFVECRVERVAGVGAKFGGLAVRVGLGYIKGLVARDAEVVVEEREREGAYGELGELASRSGATRDGLERLAWAGACAAIGGGCGRIGGQAEDAALAARRRQGLGAAEGRRAARAPARGAGRPRARGADAVGTGDGRLRLPGHRPRRAPARAAPAGARAGHGHLRRPRADPRRHRPDRRRTAGRPPTTGDRQGRDVPAARGRERGRQRDRPAARLRPSPADRADRVARLGRGAPGAPRGRDQRPRLDREAHRAARSAARRGAQHRAGAAAGDRTPDRRPRRRSARRAQLRPAGPVKALQMRHFTRFCATSLARTCVRPGASLPSPQ